VGTGFPLPPLYPGMGQIRPPPLGAMTSVFNQQGRSSSPSFRNNVLLHRQLLASFEPPVCVCVYCVFCVWVCVVVQVVCFCPPRVSAPLHCGECRCLPPITPTSNRTSRSSGQQEPSPVPGAPSLQRRRPWPPTTSLFRSRYVGGIPRCVSVACDAFLEL